MYFSRIILFTFTLCAGHVNPALQVKVLDLTVRVLPEPDQGPGLAVQGVQAVGVPAGDGLLPPQLVQCGVVCGKLLCCAMNQVKSIKIVY
jgi:hypothetical protein